MSSPRRVKLFIAGDSGTGKTAFVRQQRGEAFDPKYTPTMGVEVNPVPFSADNRTLVFNCWDTAGQERFNGLGVSGYGIGADAALIFFDLTRRCTFRNLKSFYDEVQAVRPGIPVLFIGNKCDLAERAISPDEILTWLSNFSGQRAGIGYCDISAKTGLNVDRPFKELADLLA